ncbi:LytR C-terminal domain-containing protein [Agrococcus casei]|uniref:LytR C-terminal domain-containing protein n=1 Tax=Agrococcus casei TaxID=343512 RepID=UPI003F92C7B1
MNDSYRKGDRVGAHRGWPAMGMPLWAKWLIALGLVIILTIVGVLLVQSMRADMITSNPTSSEGETPTDPSSVPEDTSVAVLDASSTEGRADSVMEQLSAAGWASGITGGASAPYDETTVFYQAPEYKAAAQAVADELGVSAISETSVDLSGSPVTVIVGTDADELGL